MQTVVVVFPFEFSVMAEEFDWLLFSGRPIEHECLEQVALGSVAEVPCHLGLKVVMADLVSSFAIHIP